MVMVNTVSVDANSVEVTTETNVKVKGYVEKNETGKVNTNN